MAHKHPDLFFLSHFAPQGLHHLSFIQRERNLDTVMLSLEHTELQINTCSGWCVLFFDLIYIWIPECSETPLANRKQFQLPTLAKQKLQAHIIRSADQWVQVRMVSFSAARLRICVSGPRWNETENPVITICSVPSLVVMTSFGT